MKWSKIYSTRDKENLQRIATLIYDKVEESIIEDCFNQRKIELETQFLYMYIQIY